jgi:predicted ester cyclase
MSDLDARAVVRRFVEAVLPGDDDTALEVVGSTLLAQRASAIRTAFPDLEVTIHQLTAERDLVAVHFTSSGTHLGVYQGCPPTGRRWAASCTAIFRVVGGRIVDFWLNWDDLAILEQIGAVKRAGQVSA